MRKFKQILITDRMLLYHTYSCNFSMSYLYLFYSLMTCICLTDTIQQRLARHRLYIWSFLSKNIVCKFADCTTWCSLMWLVLKVTWAIKCSPIYAFNERMHCIYLFTRETLYWIIIFTHFTMFVCNHFMLSVLKG